MQRCAASLYLDPCLNLQPCNFPRNCTLGCFGKPLAETQYLPILSQVCKRCDSPNRKSLTFAPKANTTRAPHRAPSPTFQPIASSYGKMPPIGPDPARRLPHFRSPRAAGPGKTPPSSALPTFQPRPSALGIRNPTRKTLTAHIPYSLIPNSYLALMPSQTHNSLTNKANGNFDGFPTKHR